MVTTRSADKRVAAEGKVGDLALRSRAAEIELASQTTGSPTPSGSTIRRRTKITVDIPVYSEAKPDVVESAEDASSYVTAQDTLGSARDVDSQFAEAAKAFDSSGVATRIEIPDSQETATSPKKDPLVRGQTPLLSGDENARLTPVSARTRGTKRKMNGESTPLHQGIQEDHDITPKAAVGSAHKRFGSEDLADSSDTVVAATQLEQDLAQDVASVSDDDDAPEVTSTKRTSSQPSTRTNKRRKATKPDEIPMKPAMVLLASTPTISAHSTESDTTIQQLEEIPTATDDPTSSLLEGASAVANTVLPADGPTSTPTVDTAIIEPIHERFVPEPDHKFTVDAPKSTSMTNNSNGLQTLQTDLSALQLHRSKKVQTRFSDRTADLPPKASNRIEDYRRSKMSARKKSRLVPDWPGKRRNFVMT